MDRFILSSSKGLAEVTRSKGQTVQFIHESVRDFLLKGNGLSRLQPRFETNFLGLSHDSLKVCCQLYMQIGLSGDLPLDKELPNAKSTEATKLRDMSSRKFPFLEYAVHNVLEHADVSDSYGVSQLAFVERFTLKDWILLDNLLEKHQIRRHTSDASFLYICAERDLPRLIRIELERVRHMDIPGERYGYPIMAALANDHEEAIKALLTLEYLTRDDKHDRALLCTSDELDEAAIYLREQRGTIISARNLVKASETLLQYIGAQKNAIAPFKALLANRKISQSPQQLLAWALRGVKPETIESLLLLGVENSSICNASQTRALLEEASRIGCQYVIKHLIREGADIRGSSALFIASKNGQYQVVALLLDADAEVNARQEHEYNKSPLYIASQYGQEQVVRVLLSGGANVDQDLSTDPGGTALYSSAANGHLEIVELLLDHGADVNSPGGYYGSPLIAASELGYGGVVELLLARGADVDMTHTRNVPQSGPLSYGSALVKVSCRGNDEIVELLLTAGADVNIQGKILSPLMGAISNGHEKVVRLLLRAGADPNLRDSQGGNPLDIALHGPIQIVELLVNAGAHVGHDNRAALAVALRRAKRARAGRHAITPDHEAIQGISDNSEGSGEA